LKGRSDRGQEVFPLQATRFNQAHRHLVLPSFRPRPVAAGDLPLHHVRFQRPLSCVVCPIYPRTGNEGEQLPRILGEQFGNSPTPRVLPPPQSKLDHRFLPPTRQPLPLARESLFALFGHSPTQRLKSYKDLDKWPIYYNS